ncbi:hypothetical protein HaLaN_03873 [Haematococcus lacustris]|uniref:Uncharacterized protein n=1 Tax=Haematococcus lacustris TaxID=44745 RepID=A0A699Z0H1_HAELA|nr:hypothetical protein HaLaN_03873 [Haematococcus lacustris]
MHLAACPAGRQCRGAGPGDKAAHAPVLGPNSLAAGRCCRATAQVGKRGGEREDVEGEGQGGGREGLEGGEQGK